jgi:hypothetical protein
MMAGWVTASPVEIKYGPSHTMTTFDFDGKNSHDFLFEVAVPGNVEIGLVCDSPIARNARIQLDNADISHRDNINPHTQKKSPLPLFIDKVKGKKNGDAHVFTVSYEVRRSDIAHTPQWKLSISNPQVSECNLAVEHNGIVTNFRSTDMLHLGSLEPVPQKKERVMVAVGQTDER